MVTRASPKFKFAHFFLVIIIIFRCSGMFRYVPECSGMFHVPSFIDGPETTGHKRFPSGHGTNYFRFVLTFSIFTSKQLLFLPICFTACAIIAKNIGLRDFEINYKADVPGETHATVQSYCITTEIGL